MNQDDYANMIAEKIHKLTRTGFFNKLRDAMHTYRDAPSTKNWMDVLLAMPKGLREKLAEGAYVQLPLPDGYDAHDKPRWTAASLSKHFGVDVDDINQFIEEAGLAAECAPHQIVGKVQ